MEESHAKAVSQRQADLTQQVVSLQRRETQLREQVSVCSPVWISTTRNEIVYYSMLITFTEAVTRKYLGRSKNRGC